MQDLVFNKFLRSFIVGSIVGLCVGGAMSIGRYNKDKSIRCIGSRAISERVTAKEFSERGCLIVHLSDDRKEGMNHLDQGGCVEYDKEDL